ncbi:MAG: lasso peptide biosynthesis B2 protein [Gemmatimonadaceae bacterium]
MIAAFRTAAWIESPRFPELLVLPAKVSPVPRSEPVRALHTARRALRLLARIPGGRWRTSCLYESVAECLVLRRAGVPAAVCIGVKRGADGTPGIEAHAWVARHETDRQFHGFSTMTVLSQLRNQR